MSHARMRCIAFLASHSLSASIHISSHRTIVITCAFYLGIVVSVNLEELEEFVNRIKR